MERVNRSLAETVRALVMANRRKDGTFSLPKEVTPEALMALAREALGDELTYYPDVNDLIWGVARHQGFIIPACPVESRGDAKAFLREYGVSNAREWYAQRGLEAKGIDGLRGSALMARNQGFWRKVILAPKLADVNASQLAPYLVKAIDFCLDELTDEDDPTLFRC